MTRLASERILDLQQPLTWCDYAIEWVLLATLLFTPAAFGTSEAWSQQIFFAAVAGLAVLMTIKLLTDRQSKMVWTWAYVPIVAYLVLVTLSTIPLPAGVLNAISPGTMREKTGLLNDLPNVAELTRTGTISFNVWSTERGLRIVTALSVLFIVAVNTFRTPQQIKRLLVLIVIAGTAVVLLTLAQDLTAEPGKLPMIYWTFTWEQQPPHPRSGPFVGHAQLGQYLNLILGAMLALTVVLVAETFDGEEVTPGEILNRLGEPKLRLVYLLLVVMVATAIANALAVSRGALIGLAVAAVVAVILILIKRGWRHGETPTVIASLVVVTLLVGATVWFFGLQTLLAAKAYNFDSSMDARAEIRSKVPAMIRKWPVMGTGLESFEWVYPWFQDSTSSGGGISDHAENDYAQTLTDTGIIGGVITAAFLAIVIGNWVRGYRGGLPIHLASIGVAFGMVATMVHSAADFAQRTPAIGVLSALLCAIAVSLARISIRRVPAEAAPSFGFSPLARISVGGVLVAAMVWTLWSVNAVRLGDKNYWVSDPQYIGNLRPQDPNFDKDLVAFFDERIAGCEAAVAYDPKSLRYIHYLSEFRWRKLARNKDPKTHITVYPTDAPDQAKQIVKELSDARALCPTFGQLYILQGKVQWELLDKARGRELLKRGYDLLPTDPEANFYLAELSAAEGDWDQAVKFSRDCFARDRRYDERICELFFDRYGRYDRAFDVFKGDGFGMYLMNLRVPAEMVELRKKISAETIHSLSEQVKARPDDGNAQYRLAEQLDIVGRKAEAADAIEKALRVEYGRKEWRLYRARLLADLGRTQEAINEVEIVRRANPQSDEARALLDVLQDPKRKRAP